MTLLSQSRVICESLGATLAEIESEGESDAVLAHLYEIVAGEGVFYNDIW